MHTTEMRMLWWARGKTRLDHVRNVDIWNEAHMYPMAEFLREKRFNKKFNKIATQGAPQMAVDKEANSLSSLLLLF